MLKHTDYGKAFRLFLYMSEKELDSILNEIKKRNADNTDDTDTEVLQSAPDDEVDSDMVMSDEEIDDEEIENPQENLKAENDDSIEEDLEFSDLTELANDGKQKNKNKIIIAIVAVVLVIAVTVGVYFGFVKKDEPEPITESATMEETTTEPVTEPISTEVNYLTGEQGFNATGQRPVAIVVENSPAARPQWGIDTPDIIVEGEVEGGISRMLWLYADYNTVPSKVGPVRSARPSFIKFSKLFDAIFIHWGGSHSKGNYTGGYETFTIENVAHIDGMSGGAMFSRDTSRSVSSEHRGVVNGEKIESTIADKGFRTEINEDNIPNFVFNDETSDISTDTSNAVNVKFSSRTDTRKFTYNESDGKYHSSDWSTDVSFENVIVLMANTTYITTPYKSSTTTYLNYTFSSGTGYVASNGTYEKINWSATNGSLKITDESGNDVTLNKGNSYIGLASSNNGGSVSF